MGANHCTIHEYRIHSPIRVEDAHHFLKHAGITPPAKAAVDGIPVAIGFG
jgi:hypothetical protein